VTESVLGEKPPKALRGGDIEPSNEGENHTLKSLTEKRRTRGKKGKKADPGRVDSGEKPSHGPRG